MKIKTITGLFDEQNVLEKLTQLGNSLVLVLKHIDFSLFRDNTLKFIGLLNRVYNTPKTNEGKPGYDVVLMMKIIFLQKLYNLRKN